MIEQMRRKFCMLKSMRFTIGEYIMEKKIKLSASEMVTEHIQKLGKPYSDTIETIRQIILSVDKEIGEQIKWNSPSFFYKGVMKTFDPKEYKRDIVVVNFRNNKILLVFPTGAIINNKSGLLEGDYKDGRRLVNFTDLNDVKAKEKALKNVLRQWLNLVEK